jgi:phosphoglycolate phosphatase
MPSIFFNKLESNFSMTLPKPRAVIFDWDNTLVNTWPVIHEAMVVTFNAMGHTPWTLQETKDRVRKSMRDAFPELFGADWQKAGDIYQKAYRESSLSKLEALPQAQELLELINELGLYNVVVSNKKGPVLRSEVEHIGWNHYFKKIVGADDAARDKPHGDPVHLALEHSAIQPTSDVWFIGDSDVDLECALNTGCTAILYGESAKNHPQYSTTHFHGIPYHAHVHGHDALLALLRADGLVKFG